MGKSMDMKKGSGKRLALVTIGQAPRVDIVPDMMGTIDASFEITEFGALDGLTPAELAAMAPEGDEPCLVSRLRDGTEIVCSEAKIEERLDALFKRIDPAKFDAILMLCSGHLQGVSHSLPIYFPYEALQTEIGELVAAGEKIGLISPHARQIDKMKSYFSEPGQAAYASASPYGANEFETAGTALKNTDVIIMNCMGYDAAMAGKVREAAGVRTTTVRQLFMKHVTKSLS
ncbi:MAG: AroM family protein [Sneathiella sp.]|nr:AroM family protein [Sneathiella sp.]